jgi:glucose/arabinose dehydrogenase
MAPMRRAAAFAVLALALCIPGGAAARVDVPPGFKVETFARGIPHPTNLAFDPTGRLWVTSAEHVTARGDGVWMVPRRGARPRQVVRRLFSALGLLWHDGELYVSYVVPYSTVASPPHTGRVVAYSGFDGRRFTRRRVVVEGIPTGRHRVDSLAAGPDGRIYLGVGSVYDSRRSRDALSASVVSFRPGGGDLRVEARGLRNPYGLAFIPGTARLLVSEHGRDDLGLNRPPEEVNLIRTGGSARWYGFPECWGQGGAACEGATPPLVRLRAHSAPGAVVVAPRFGRYGRSAFVTRYGSSFRENPSGGDIVRISLPARGRPRVRRFATGFGLYEPLGLALGPRDGLYASLWRSGRVVRVVPRRSELRAVRAATRAFRAIPAIGSVSRANEPASRAVGSHSRGITCPTNCATCSPLSRGMSTTLSAPASASPRSARAQSSALPATAIARTSSSVSDVASAPTPASSNSRG